MIRLLAVTDIDDFVRHSDRQMRENGQGTTVRFALRPPGAPGDSDRLRRSLAVGLNSDVGDPAWCRVWIDDGPPEIRGHVALRSHAQAGAAHRALLSVGVLEPYRRSGVALRLMQAAIEWATRHDRLQWLDSEVFGHNQPALDLHRRVGFVEAGRVPDMFRLDDISVDDLRLVLRLGRG